MARRSLLRGAKGLIDMGTVILAMRSSKIGCGIRVGVLNDLRKSARGAANTLRAIAWKVGGSEARGGWLLYAPRAGRHLGPQAQQRGLPACDQASFGFSCASRVRWAIAHRFSVCSEGVGNSMRVG